MDAESDGSGHGAQVTSIGANSSLSDNSGGYRGIAPDAGFVIVRAFDADGQASYADVIRGIDWIVENKDTHDVRILNLSFSAPPQSRYWQNPLNQAVMAAWEDGIVVVASAGNGGPEPMTVGVPGNVPYVVTVGAVTDSYRPADPTGDVVASFSAVGPTHEGFVKPEVLAPGGHIVAMMSRDGQIAVEHPEFHDTRMLFTMSVACHLDQDVSSPRSRISELSRRRAWKPTAPHGPALAGGLRTDHRPV